MSSLHVKGEKVSRKGVECGRIARWRYAYRAY